ncbi:MAG TPA: PQ-loop domain-containing transporter [Candidatus Nanoarchaeia archaeon]|nr:PQ-loop domain-containing transporter [Candidatus Nanoarchaeia archaeon]
MNPEILGYIAGTLVVVSLLPQIIKSWKTRSTKDISAWRYGLYAAGLSIWVIYGFLIRSWPVTLLMGVELLLAISVLMLKIKHG